MLRSCYESREIFGGNVMHNHELYNETILNRRILNISVKRKANGDLCDRPCGLKHKELQSQDLDTLTYTDIQNISRNTLEVRIFQLLPLQTNIEETSEALSALQVSTSAKKRFSLLMTRNSGVPGGGFKPPPPKFRKSSKIVPNSTRL